MSNRIFGGGCILIGILYVFFASQTALTLLTDPLGPRPFPMLIGLTLSAAGAVVFLKPGIEPDWPQFSRILELLFAITIMVVYAVTMPHVGFVTASILAIALMSWRMGAHPYGAITVGLIVSVSIFIIFNKVLGLSLAVGPWGF